MSNNKEEDAYKTLEVIKQTDKDELPEKTSKPKDGKSESDNIAIQIIDLGGCKTKNKKTKKQKNKKTKKQKTKNKKQKTKNKKQKTKNKKNKSYKIS